MSEAPILDPSDEIVFADEGQDLAPARAPWKVLVADDEEVIHGVTRLALDDFRFEGRGLLFLGARSGEETLRLLEQHPDTAVLLLDVVMETDDAGLRVARRIREEMKNPFVRIILRTGQPGMAPEKRVVTQYDINDYKEKTELTEQKLFTTVTAAIRAYRDLRTIEKNKKGLELIIDSTGCLFAEQRIQRFTEGVLTQLQALLQLDESSLVVQASGFAASHDRDRFSIVAATGRFQGFLGRYVDEIVSPELQSHLDEAFRRQECVFAGDAYVGFFRTDSGSVNLVYLGCCDGLTPLERDLIRTFSSNVAIAYDRIYLHQEIVETQQEVIEILGSVVETRSSETANHVRRVAEFTHLLALGWGLGEREAHVLKQASPMHDVGKIGVPDAILNKPGRLTEEEFEQIKTHAAIGHSILKGSRREIMRAAAIVAHEHHERWDGAGYPRALRGEAIHPYGRISALADVFDALLSRRAYKEPMPVEAVVELVGRERGRQFDPGLVDVFLRDLDLFLAKHRALEG